eukprot:Gb_39698 [translate_table: standard]
MAGGYTSLPTSHLLGSVPAAVDADHKASEFEEANLQIFPPSNGQSRTWGYQPPNDVDDLFAQRGAGGEGTEQPQSQWKGFFSIASYRPYFNVDTFHVGERIMGSLHPHEADFFEKIRYNPDLYGPVWISTTLVILAAALGNYASYLSFTQSEHSTHWVYDINYFSWATCVFYGYICLVPLGFYFLLQYLGIPSSLVQLWCLFGYSLFIFIPASLLLIFPSEFVRWTVITLSGLVSASFVAFNMRSHIMSTSDGWTIAVPISFVLQISLALMIKLCFFI